MLPRICYAAPVWTPFNLGDKELLEKVQRRAVMMVTNLVGSYEERLSLLGLRTLEDRRVRGDMIETFKILARKSDVKH